MPRSRKSFKSLLEAYTSKATQAFSFTEISTFIRSHQQFKVIEFDLKLKELLLADPWIFVDESTETCTPRRLYFQGARFLIFPTEEELQAGVLFPGHRFSPFCSHRHFPPESTISLADGSQIKRKQVHCFLHDVLIYHSLFSMSHVIQYFAVDNEDNIQVLSQDNPEKQELTLTVFNLNAFYKERNFQSGDSLLLTVRDWDKGIYDFDVLSAAQLDAQAKAAGNSFKQLEAGLLRVFEQFGIGLEVSEQIAYAYFFAGPEFLRQPLTSISQVVNHSKRIELTSAGMERILWRKGERPEDSLSFASGNLLKGDMDSLNDILADIGVAITQSEIEAYMRNECFTRRNSFEAALDACFAHRDKITFYNEEQKNEFFRYLKALWKDIVGKYNYFKDQETGKYRARALAIYSYCTQWIAELDEKGIDVNFMPKEEMLSFFQVMGKLSELFETLNQHMVRRDEEEKLSVTLDEIEITVGVIKDKFEQKLKPDLKLLKED